MFTIFALICVSLLSLFMLPDDLDAEPAQATEQDGDPQDSVQQMDIGAALFGDGGDNDFAGGAGDDWMDGQAGDDQMTGGDGADELNGDLGQDSLFGGSGDDSLFGQDGDDQLWGDDGNDLLNGGDGGDALDGGAGDDRLSGGLGNDSLQGGDGADTLFGGAGDDRLDGGDDAHRDYANGGAGDDTLVAHDDDVLSGGSGADRFEFSYLTRYATISDFDPAEDALVLVYDAEGPLPVLGADVTESGLAISANGAVIAVLPGQTSIDLGSIRLLAA